MGSSFCVKGAGIVEIDGVTSGVLVVFAQAVKKSANMRVKIKGI